MNLKLDTTKLTPEQRDKLEQYQQTETQIQTLQDIADMTQEVINILDDYKKDKKVDNLGVLLTDIRESLTAIKDKEDPETPDFSKPVVNAVKQLESALSSSIKSIDFNPKIKVDAPAVNVTPPSVDLKGIEKAVSGLSKAFKEAISSINIPENDDGPTVEALNNILEQLSSIDSAVRIKPQTPNTLKVTNPDGSVIGQETYTYRYDYDANPYYVGYATVGVASSSTGWTITKYDLTDPNNATGLIATDVSWNNRASGSYA